MMRLRRASVIATLSLLAWAATASAECAWVMWFTTEATGQRVWTPMAGYASAADCYKALERERYAFPDTVDPRGPKRK
jgi:hypothetical protein